jgi:hypothetical protein
MGLYRLRLTRDSPHSCCGAGTGFSSWDAAGSPILPQYGFPLSARKYRAEGEPLRAVWQRAGAQPTGPDCGKCLGKPGGVACPHFICGRQGAGLAGAAQ